jgi:hypothetical protein
MEVYIMASRLELHEELCKLLGTRNVYFQPPESKKLEYDCIVYNLADIASRYANNKHYTGKKRYDVVIISRNPDNILIDEMLNNFSYIGFDRSFAKDNLYHFVYDLYY